MKPARPSRPRAPAAGPASSPTGTIATANGIAASQRPTTRPVSEPSSRANSATTATVSPPQVSGCQGECSKSLRVAALVAARGAHLVGPARAGQPAGAGVEAQAGDQHVRVAGVAVGGDPGAPAA